MAEAAGLTYMTAWSDIDEIQTRDVRRPVARGLRLRHRPDAPGPGEHLRRHQLPEALRGREAPDLLHREGPDDAPPRGGRRPVAGGQRRARGDRHDRDGRHLRRPAGQQRRPHAGGALEPDVRLQGAPEHLGVHRRRVVDRRGRRQGDGPDQRRDPGHLPARLLPDERELGRQVPEGPDQDLAPGRDGPLPPGLLRPQGSVRLQPARLHHATSASRRPPDSGGRSTTSTSSSTPSCRGRRAARATS